MSFPIVYGVDETILKLPHLLEHTSIYSHNCSVTTRLSLVDQFKFTIYFIDKQITCGNVRLITQTANT